MAAPSKYLAKSRALRLLIVVTGFAAATYFAYGSILLVLRGQAVEAVCTSLDVKTTEARDGRRTSVTYHLAYPVEGQGMTEGTIRGGLSFQLAEGDKIEVLYDPRKPSRVRANRFESLWGLSCIFGALGLMCLPGLLRKPAS
ncbi:DUF3592 domain-containing protein [Roseimaritima ulvae]|uniref:DUF3592 domain-containing protein n=1 Tax=Roseimaritima ulvae TaxID=980254 RepID=A0A5B9R9T2_9BACT|nr:DUF3592 domain-containing protein [Roseimaritima ulvae]QEG43623.1 hypothetical protein UC8_56740 [Roseimaritima ulvae]